MYTGARLPWGTLNPGGWLGDGPAAGTTRLATTGKRPLPWGTLNPGGYLGDTSINDLISQGLQTVGSIFGNGQNAAPTPSSGVSYPAYQQPVQSGLFGLPTPVVLGGLALVAVLLLKKR